MSVMARFKDNPRKKHVIPGRKTRADRAKETALDMHLVWKSIIKQLHQPNCSAIIPDDKMWCVIHLNAWAKRHKSIRLVYEDLPDGCRVTRKLKR